MKIVLNGEQCELSTLFTVGQLLEKSHLHPETVVNELNRVILARQLSSEHELVDGDHIEIIRFIGGG
jgi:sulfur carrier protein